jgi:AraC-like DNA-binding protein
MPGTPARSRSHCLGAGIDSADLDAPQQGTCLGVCRDIDRAIFCSSRRAFHRGKCATRIDLDDLAGVAGVSARALQMGFRRFRNTTPMAYLRGVRLELARTELARAKRSGGSIASVAYLCGFGHLGRFAADYKARFNESPSQTRLRGSVGRSS